MAKDDRDDLLEQVQKLENSIRNREADIAEIESYVKRYLEFEQGARLWNAYQEYLEDRSNMVYELGRLHERIDEKAPVHEEAGQSQEDRSEADPDEWWRKFGDEEAEDEPEPEPEPEK